MLCLINMECIFQLFYVDNQFCQMSGTYFISMHTFMYKHMFTNKRSFTLNTDGAPTSHICQLSRVHFHSVSFQMSFVNCRVCHRFMIHLQSVRLRKTRPNPALADVVNGWKLERSRAAAETSVALRIPSSVCKGLKPHQSRRIKAHSSLPASQSV